MQISFVGDIMLGRLIQRKYLEQPYRLLSQNVEDKLRNSDYIIANLESPITNMPPADSITFAGNPLLLEQFNWISCFSLSNNHINDFGSIGMNDTLENLAEIGIPSNGLYQLNYTPYLIERGENEKVAIIMCTDMLNYEFDSSCPYHTLRIGTPLLEEIILKYKSLGYFLILYAHVGSLFTRYPNPPIRSLLYSYANKGVDCIVTAHSHCLGGMEYYKGIPIFYSIGDFLMDGSSFRRRQACILEMKIENKVLKDWNITPTYTNFELQTIFPSKQLEKKILKSFDSVSKRLANKIGNEYVSFYKYQYKKEIVYHSFSTLTFLYKSKGMKGMMRILRIRIWDIFRMIKRILVNRSKMRYDSDALYKKHKLKDNDIL